MNVNPQVLEGRWNEIRGRIQQRWGQLSSEQLDIAHGDLEQLVSTIERETGEPREAVENYLEELTSNGSSRWGDPMDAARDYAEATREAAEEAARHAAESFQAGYAKTERAIQKKPLESLAVCFGAGVITGVVVGLLVRNR